MNNQIMVRPRLGVGSTTFKSIVYTGILLGFFSSPIDRLFAQNAPAAAPSPDPPTDGEKPPAVVPPKPQGKSNDASLTAKREEALLQDQIELQKLLRSLGTDHPKIRELKDRIKLTQDWLNEQRKNQKKTLLIKVPNRDPKEIAKLLADLYGEKVNVVVDQPTSSVLVAVTNATAAGEAQSLLTEIEATAKRLEPVSVVVTQTEIVPQPPVDTFPSDEQDIALDREAKKLAAELRNAKPDEQAKLRKDLEAVTEKQFEHRQKRRKNEFELLTQRVERLKAIHTRRQKNKAEVIQRRIKELLDPNADLRWEDSVSTEDLKVTQVDSAGLKATDMSEAKKRPAEGFDVNTDETHEATYNGMTLAQALKVIETERNIEKLADAVLALNYLMDQGDPRQLVRATLKMMRLQGTNVLQPPRNVIMYGSVNLLRMLPSDIVVEELMAELPLAGSRKPTREFITFFLYLNQIGDVYDTDHKKFVLVVDQSKMADSAQRLKSEIRHKSRRLVSSLVHVAQQNDEASDWAMRTAGQIVRISNETIATYPELIPLVEREFAKPEPKTAMAGNAQFNGVTFKAAILLGEGGLRVSDVIAFAERHLKIENEFEQGVRCLIAVAPYSPEAVNLLTDTLRTKWTSVTEMFDHETKKPKSDYEPAEQPGPAENKVELLKSQCVQLVRALVQIGTPAKPSIPQLREISDSPKSTVSVLVHEHEFGSPMGVAAGGGFGGGMFGAGGGMFGGGMGGMGMGMGNTEKPMRDFIKSAIERIESAKPKAKSEPLPEDKTN